MPLLHPIINANGEDVTKMVYDRTLQAIGTMEKAGDLSKAGETVTTANNLVAINLEAPSKLIFPAETPIINELPRVAGTGLSAQWREVTAMEGNLLLPAMQWAREGQRVALMDIDTIDRSVPYATIGVEGSVTFEAQSAAVGFEDAYAQQAIRLMLQMKISEEKAVLGANRSLALGTTAVPTLSASGTGGTLPAATYSVRVFALTYEGLGQTTITSGIKRQVVLTGADGKSYTLNGGSSAAGVAATQAVTLGQTLFMSVPVVVGASGYAWFVGTAGAERLERITTLNSASINTTLLGTGQTLASITDPTVDRSFNNGTAGTNTAAFDGLLTYAWSSPLAQRIIMATGTPGTGTGLTATEFGIAEIDQLILQMFDQKWIVPDVLFVSPNGLRNIRNKLLGAPATGKLRVNTSLNEGQLRAGVRGMSYYTEFGQNGKEIEIRAHNYMPRGSLLAWSRTLPSQYSNAGIGVTAVIDARRDYYQTTWPMSTRANETGVYAEEALKVYAPFALGLIANCSDL